MNDPSQSSQSAPDGWDTKEWSQRENARLQHQVEQLQEEVAFLKRQLGAGAARDLSYFVDDQVEVPEENTEKEAGDAPEIILCGLPGSGKTSIRNVVFEQGSPDFQQRNAPTTSPTFLRVDRGELVFDLVELPFTHAQQDSILSHAKAAQSLLFVLDAQEAYEDALTWACRLIKKLNQINTKIGFHILLHKMDGDHLESPEQRRHVLRSVHEFLEETLETDAEVAVHCTSIYHPTLFEALSRVIQRMMPHLPALELLLNSLVEKNMLEKALLMDGKTKLVVCSDSSTETVAEPLFKMACDMMDLTEGFCSITDFSSVNHLTITFDQDFVVRLRYLNPTLVLVFMVRADSNPSNKLVDHNLCIFDNALLRLLKDMR